MPHAVVPGVPAEPAGLGAPSLGNERRKLTLRVVMGSEGAPDRPVLLKSTPSQAPTPSLNAGQSPSHVAADEGDLTPNTAGSSLQITTPAMREATRTSIAITVGARSRFSRVLRFIRLSIAKQESALGNSVHVEEAEATVQTPRAL